MSRREGYDLKDLDICIRKPGVGQTLAARFVKSRADSVVPTERGAGALL